MDETITIHGTKNENIARSLYWILNADVSRSDNDNLEFILEFTTKGQSKGQNVDTKLPSVDSREAFVAAFQEYVKTGEEYYLLFSNIGPENAIPDDYGVRQSSLRIHTVKNGVKSEDHYLIDGVKQKKANVRSRLRIRLANSMIGKVFQYLVDGCSEKAGDHFARKLEEAKCDVRRAYVDPLHIQVEHVKPTTVPTYQ